jgi:hypothetical protein
MCTITVVPHERGVRLVCNRDERRTRPAALPPRIHHLGGHPALFPRDPQGGGTWIGVNGAGIAVALLNRCRTVDANDTTPKRSRGLVVRELLRCTSLSQAAAAVEALDPRAFEPFQVVIVGERRVLAATSAAGTRIRCTAQRFAKPLLFTSSSLGDRLVDGPRRRLFDRLVVRSRAGWLSGQAQFHEHQWRDRPDISVRMERDDARTVSRTKIDVTNDGALVQYEALGFGACEPENLTPRT